MEDISKILSNKTVKPPKEIDELKKFIQSKYNEEVKISVKSDSLIVEVSNSSLANAIRYDESTIRKLITNKKIIIRTSR
jgi:endonuclease III-like uncharacterized protein